MRWAGPEGGGRGPQGAGGAGPRAVGSASVRGGAWGGAQRKRMRRGAGLREGRGRAGRPRGAGGGGAARGQVGRGGGGGAMRRRRAPIGRAALVPPVARRRGAPPPGTCPRGVALAPRRPLGASGPLAARAGGERRPGPAEHGEPGAAGGSATGPRLASARRRRHLPAAPPSA